MEPVTLFVRSSVWPEGLAMGEAIKQRQDLVCTALATELRNVACLEGPVRAAVAANLAVALLLLELQDAFRDTLTSFYFGKPIPRLLSVLQTCHQKEKAIPDEDLDTDCLFYRYGGVAAVIALDVETKKRQGILAQIKRLPLEETKVLAKYIEGRPKEASIGLWIENESHQLEGKPRSSRNGLPRKRGRPKAEHSQKVKRDRTSEQDEQSRHNSQAQLNTCLNGSHISSPVSIPGATPTSSIDYYDQQAAINLSYGNRLTMSRAQPSGIHSYKPGDSHYSMSSMYASRTVLAEPQQPLEDYQSLASFQGNPDEFTDDRVNAVQPPQGQGNTDAFVLSDRCRWVFKEQERGPSCQLPIGQEQGNLEWGGSQGNAEAFVFDDRCPWVPKEQERGASGQLPNGQEQGSAGWRESQGNTEAFVFDDRCPWVPKEQEKGASDLLPVYQEQGNAGWTEPQGNTDAFVFESQRKERLLFDQDQGNTWQVYKEIDTG